MLQGIKVCKRWPWHWPLALHAMALLGLCLFSLPSELRGKAQAPSNEKGEEAPAVQANSNGYVHNWLSLPAVKGNSLSGEPVSQGPKPGTLEVLIFIASWCVPCQELTKHVLELKKKYEQLNTRFTFIFAHDLPQDAQGFAEAYQISPGVIATHDILKEFHNPELPTIYLGDRHGWLLARFPRTSSEDLKNIENIIKTLTSY